MHREQHISTRHDAYLQHTSAITFDWIVASTAFSSAIHHRGQGSLASAEKDMHIAPGTGHHSRDLSIRRILQRREFISMKSTFFAVSSSASGMPDVDGEGQSSLDFNLKSLSLYQRRNLGGAGTSGFDPMTNHSTPAEVESLQAVVDDS
jgi:hypothetical protein